jgi:hypothetical protein
MFVNVSTPGEIADVGSQGLRYLTFALADVDCVETENPEKDNVKTVEAVYRSHTKRLEAY